MRDLRNKEAQRFIEHHGLRVAEIRSQPFLGSDIHYELGDDGWSILLYPRVAGTYEGTSLILASLASILRREKPWFTFPNADEFGAFVETSLASATKLSKLERDGFENEYWGFYNSFCFAFELDYLLKNDYQSPTELRRLVSYLSTHFVTVTVASEFLASMSVLRQSNGDVSWLHEEFIARKRYDFLTIVDAFQESLARNAFTLDDVNNVFNAFFPDLQQSQDALSELQEVSDKVLGPRNESQLDYDVAISFAGEERSIAREIADKLVQNSRKVFFDEYEKANLWGKDLYSHLSEVYGKRARYCLMLVSENYGKKQWTNHERKAAQAKAFSENEEYILPLRLDDTDIPGLLDTVGYLDLRHSSVEEVVELLSAKIDRA